MKITPNSQSIEPLAYRPDALPALIGVSRSRVFELLRSGELASVKRGGMRLITRREIDRFLQADEAEAA